MAGSKNTPAKKVGAAGRRKKSKSAKPNFKTYIHRVLKETHPTIGITKKSMGIMNDLVVDMMDKLAAEAKTALEKSGKGKTLKEWHCNTATKLVLPGELQKHGVSEGIKAMSNYRRK
eukprot:CAMPEP_0181102278 /NCGR_PEP_ID=MMETSP1071-20121207/14230_1 /TAXON_ID=35127 /ORGANISM="Thalassiosira sp., Strain NH16" /LENGTH=116 /DNA_ID=CAMNT_0023185241 /DNA_START=580 /DNA_END=930 /DNA_ORIENTATION=-